MNPQEKIHFKRIIGKNRLKTHVFTLFDRVCKMKNHDEKRLREGLDSVPLQKHLKRYKSYTYDYIIHSLLDYHSDTSATLQISRHLQAIEILCSKQLYKHALKIIRKAEELAKKNEFFHYLMIISEWKDTIVALLADLPELKKYESVYYKEEIKNAIRYQNLLEHKLLLNKVRIQLLQAGDFPAWGVNKRTEKLRSHALLSNEKNALSSAALEVHFNILGNIYWSMKDLKKSANYMVRALEQFEKNPIFTLTRINDHIRRAGFTFTIMARLGMHQELVVLKNKIDVFIQSLPQKLRSISLYREYMVIMNNYIDHQIQVMDLNEAERTSEEVKEIMEIQGGMQNYQVFYFNLFQIRFFRQEFRKALQAMNKLLATDKSGIRQDIIQASKIIYLAIHFELGNEDLYMSLASSVRKYILKFRKLTPLEDILLDFFERKKRFGKKMKSDSLSELADITRKLIMKDPEIASTEMFNWLAWITSKNERCSFADLIKAEAKK